MLPSKTEDTVTGLMPQIQTSEITPEQKPTTMTIHGAGVHLGAGAVITAADGA